MTLPGKVPRERRGGGGGGVNRDPPPRKGNGAQLLTSQSTPFFSLTPYSSVNVNRAKMAAKTDMRHCGLQQGSELELETDWPWG